MRSRILAGGLLLVLSGGVMAGQIYKWVDAQGVTHFGAQPPAGQAAESFSTATPVPKPVSTPPAAGSETEPDQQAIDEKVKREVARQEADRKSYCTTLRTNLAQLENNPRVRIEEAGQLRRLGEEERQQRISETKQKISDTCS
ncbi:DUF4124 domain-containing protein [Pseudomonas sp. PS1]|uniref:DUF4124 domain-containing protein n=1 Tax=Stutzerimonas marianensis TaxID=2929513 RepID=A0A9X1WCQ6_9GAMM|nr:DUF4124 domain-containing protein [Pseudomonas marianensis]MCJ0975503.1 DUF4124 domain-containing protein [Pseudomonas marianensis]